MGRLIQPSGSGTITTDNVACERTVDRIAREIAEGKIRKPDEPELTPTQKAGQMYAELHRREQAQKQQERARLITEGKIVINPDGSETHHLKGFGY